MKDCQQDDAQQVDSTGTKRQRRVSDIVLVRVVPLVTHGVAEGVSDIVLVRVVPLVTHGTPEGALPPRCRQY